MNQTNKVKLGHIIVIPNQKLRIVSVNPDLASFRVKHQEDESQSIFVRQKFGCEASYGHADGPHLCTRQKRYDISNDMIGKFIVADVNITDPIWPKAKRWAPYEKDSIPGKMTETSNGPKNHVALEGGPKRIDQQVVWPNSKAKPSSASLQISQIIRIRHPEIRGQAFCNTIKALMLTNSFGPEYIFETFRKNHLKKGGGSWDRIEDPRRHEGRTVWFKKSALAKVA